MISDSKYVKSVDSNTPKKGWVVTWTDGKRDFIFEEAWLKLLSNAQEEERLVHFTKEQNAKGYWNIQTLELAELPDSPPEAVQPNSEPSTPVSSGNVPITLTQRDKDIHLQVAYKGATEMCANGLFPHELRYDLAILDEKFLNREITPGQAKEQYVKGLNSMTK